MHRQHEAAIRSIALFLSVLFATLVILGVLPSVRACARNWHPVPMREPFTSVSRGAVTLSGQVASWPERSAAIADAYSAGTKAVIDRLRIAR